MKKQILIAKELTNKGLLIVFLLVGINHLLIAQDEDIDFNTCPPAGTIYLLPSQAGGQPITGMPSISTLNPTATSLTITSIILPSVGDFCTSGGNCAVSPVNVTGTNIVFTINNPATSPELVISSSGAGIDPSVTGQTIVFTLHATAPGKSCFKTYSFTVRNPVDLMMVLDKSGSMGLPLSGSTRWETLKSGVGDFFSTYKPLLLSSGDKIGIRMFSSSVGHLPAGSFASDGLVAVTASTDMVESHVFDGEVLDGSTALGEGLLSAHSFLPASANRKRAIILFTDGEQNTGTFVDATGARPMVGATDISDGGQIKIHTIGLNLAGAPMQTLYDIAHKSGGTTNIPGDPLTTDPALDLTNTFSNIRNALLTGSSPQYVDVRRNKFKMLGNYFGAEESFTVSKNIDKIFINIISDIRNESILNSIEKNGTKLNLSDTSYITSTRGNGWATWVINVQRINKKIPGFTSDGTWLVRVLNGSQSAAPYIISLTVDDHLSKMIGATNQTKELVAGDHLPVSVDFKRMGVPLTGATVVAGILRPGDDLGDLLARTEANINFSTDPDADNPGTQKYLELLKDSAFAKKLLSDSNLIPLTYNAGKQLFTGDFNGLNVSGTYKIIYRVSVNDSILGNIKRYQEENFYVRFPDIDLNNSNVQLVPGKDSNLSTLTFRLIANNGKFVGPGWGSAIKLDSKNNKLTNIIDNGDGSYSLAINGSTSENVTLSIGGAKLYTGKLEDITNGGGPDGNEPWWKKIWIWILALIGIVLGWLGIKKKKTP